MGFVFKRDNNNQLPKELFLQVGPAEGDFAIAARPADSANYDVSLNGEIVTKLTAQAALRAAALSEDSEFGKVKNILVNPFLDQSCG